MKMIIKLIAALLIVSSAAGVSAAADSTGRTAACKIVELKDGTYKVIYQSSQIENVTITLTDSKNTLVYSEKIAGLDGFMKNYNLKNLPAGTYTLKVKGADYAYEEEVVIGKKEFNLLLSKVEEKKVMFMGFLPKTGSLTLYILDDHSDVIYSEVVGDAPEVKKAFNFEQVRGASVTFVIYHEGTLIREKKFEF